jgi:hypothetical protein
MQKQNGHLPAHFKKGVRPFCSSSYGTSYLFCLVALNFLFKGAWLLASHASHVSLKLSTGKMVAVFC